MILTILLSVLTTLTILAFGAWVARRYWRRLQVVATGTVSKPAVPQKPQSAEWTRLEAAKTIEELDALDLHARQHGFGPEGQLRAAIKGKREALGT